MPSPLAHFEELRLVIVATAALSTVTPNDEAAHENPKTAGNEMEKPSWDESMVPAPDQVAAEATDGTTDTHNANTTPKSDKMLFNPIVNISNTLRAPRNVPSSSAAIRPR
jgi:hypothetical protein